MRVIVDDSDVFNQHNWTIQITAHLFFILII